MKSLHNWYGMALAVFLAFGALPAHAQTPVKLTLGHNAAAGTSRAEAAAKFVELVKAKSNGHITVEIAGEAKLGDNQAMMTAVRTGALDMSINSHGTLSTLVPELSALSLPFTFSSVAKVWEIMDGSVGQDLNKKIEAQDMIVLGWMENGSRHITNSKRPIVKPEDMKGLKMRTTADKAVMDMMAALGATSVPINFSDLHMALKAGYVDGQENPLSNIKSAKLYEVQKFISITNHSFGLAPFIISKATWNKLSSDDKKTVQAAAQEATAFQRKLSEEQDQKLLAEFKNMASVKVNVTDPAPFRAATKKVWDSWELKPFGAFVKKLRSATN